MTSAAAPESSPRGWRSGLSGVDALDSSPVMIAETERTVPANVTCLLGDVTTAELPAGGYDAVTSISALHHMDLPEVLPRLGASLRPGGLLIAVSLHRLEILRGLPAEAVSVFGSNARRVVLLCLPGGPAVPAGDVPAARGSASVADDEPGADPPAGPHPGRGGPARIAGAVAGPLAL